MYLYTHIILRNHLISLVFLLVSETHFSILWVYWKTEKSCLISLSSVSGLLSLFSIYYMFREQKLMGCNTKTMVALSDWLLFAHSCMIHWYDCVSYLIIINPFILRINYYQPINHIYICNNERNTPKTAI